MATAAIAGRRASAAPPLVTDDETDSDTGPSTEGSEDELPAVAVDPHAGRGGAVLLVEVTRELAAMRSSRYSHTTSVDEPNGRFDYDCSGLVDYALARVLPDAFGELRTATVKRPLAKHFVQLLAAIAPTAHDGRWHRVTRASELQPGDIIAWLKPADSVTKNTGHVLIVRGAVTTVPGAHDQLEVPIIDSTSVSHGASDSRFHAKASGLGTGTIYLTIDRDGAPTGYLWSHGKHAQPHVTTVALGRLD